MSGETEHNVSGWTTDTLRLFFQQQMDDRKTLLDERFGAQTKAIDDAIKAADKAVQAALSSAKEAVTKAEVATDKRFEAVNEFRGQLSDQANTFIPRAEHNAIINRLATDVQELKDRMNTNQGKGMGMQAGWGMLLGGVGFILTLLLIAAAIASFTS